MDDPVRTHQSNFIGTLNVCEAMRQHGVRRVVYASSAAVYGNNGEGVAIDEATAKAPLTPYAADKLASEIIDKRESEAENLRPLPGERPPVSLSATSWLTSTSGAVWVFMQIGVLWF